MNTRKKGQQPRTRNLARTREKILQASREEFAWHGLQGARVDRIAKNAGVNKQMIYYIFHGKEELYLAALESLWEAKAEAVDKPMFGEQITLNDFPMLIGRLMDTFAANPEATKMVVYDIIAGAQFIRQLKKKRPDLFVTYERVTLLLESLMQAGLIKKIDADKAIFLVAMVVAFFPIMRPHFDILTGEGTDKHRSLTDLESWKTFIAEALRRLLLVE